MFWKYLLFKGVQFVYVTTLFFSVKLTSIDYAVIAIDHIGGIWDKKNRLGKIYRLKKD